jgi:hypothetical protein
MHAKYARTHPRVLLTCRPEFRPRWWLLSGSIDSVTYQASCRARRMFPMKIMKARAR